MDISFNRCLTPIGDDLMKAVETVYQGRKHGHFEQWLSSINRLPILKSHYAIDENYTVNIGSQKDISNKDLQLLERILLILCPWRKGPFNLFGVLIDSEWRSNLKWRRIEQSSINFENKRILDVGCGNGYYMFQMLSAGAQYVLGIDPCQLFVSQFYLFKRYLDNLQADVLPLCCEELPLLTIQERQVLFDMVFSMGVLYHRKNPIQHLREISGLIKKDGEVILETLIIEGEQKLQLIPKKSYAKMPNVSSIPTECLLRDWLSEAGLSNVTTINISRTTTDEQRKTCWMDFESLANFLDKKDHTRTIEGYPAPVRILLHCQP